MHDFRPPYNKEVVHVDLNDTAIQQLKTYYVSRSQYAQVIANLAAMGTAAQAYDVIFAAETNRADDQAIIKSTEESKNVYFGMDLRMTAGKEANSGIIAPEVSGYMDQTKWNVRVDGDLDGFYSGSRPFVTFPSLARASRGIGFLTLHYDLDGVIRRVPLLVRYENGFYPSFPFRVVCDYLGVTPDRITVRPGRYIKLEGARKPGRHPSGCIHSDRRTRRDDHQFYRSLVPGDYDPLRLCTDTRRIGRPGRNGNG